MSEGANLDHLRALLEPALAGRGVELFDMTLGGGVLSVTVDRAGGGINLKDITTVTQELNEILDSADPVAGRYTLEVASPGIERPLRTPTHFVRAVGETVKVRTRPEVEGDRRAQGELIEADDDGVEINTNGGPRRLAYTDIERARTVFDWDREVKR